MQEARYAEALEQQLAALRWWLSARGQEFKEELQNWNAMSAGLVNPCTIHSLQFGHTVYWASTMLPLLKHAAETLPPMTLTEGLAPGHEGWCWFGEPLGLLTNDGRMYDLTAIGWSTVGTSERAGLGVQFWVSNERVPWGLPLYPIVWEYGQTQQQAAYAQFEDSGADGFAELLGVFGAMLLLMSQQILVTTTHSAPRATRKRAERAEWPHEPIVRVVELRRRVSRDHAAQTSEEAAWSCQWLVRGHWRQHWYPKARIHQPRWIAPHVKGPEDKPLKSPSQTLFAVVR